MANRLNSLYRDFTGGANNALASTLGAPVDLVNRYTVNQPNALLGSDWIRNKLNTAGIGTQGNGVAGFTGGILGSMAVPGAGLLNAIDTSAQIAQAQTPMGMLLAAGGGLLGEGINALSKPRVMQEMTAYHGSPHDFDEFKLDKIGTGEGAQAYGHGLYFAENPNVARQYAETLGQADHAEIRRINSELSRIANEREAITKAAIGVSGTERMPLLQKHSALGDEYDRLLSLRTEVGNKRGKFYNVDIPDSAINNMLDWDKPLSEQPESVRKALQEAGIFDAQTYERGTPAVFSSTGKEIFPATKPVKDWTGKDIYKSLGEAKPEGVASQYAWKKMLDSKYQGQGAYGQFVASNLLKEYGIPGIRYLDGGSRGSGTGTRNFVVFDDKLVKVLKKE